MEINDFLGVIMRKLAAMSNYIEALKAAPKTPFADFFRRDGTRWWRRTHFCKEIAS
jgi:hypothetical protein